jgi:hypothetical protein
LTARSALAVAVAVTAGCAPALRSLGPPPSATTPEDAAPLAAEVHALARRIEREPAASRREALSRDAVTAGQRCEQAAPGSPPCDYALAIALGLQARERPSTAREGLALMASMLRRAAAADPDLDRAGPDRVLALLLLRAPGWPLGPGDPEQGLDAARRSAARFPDHAPNQLALAEALRANGDSKAGREAARRALALAEAAAAAAAGDPDAAGWLRDARKLVNAP